MASFLPDTSCIVPTVATWHAQHASASAEVDRRLVEGQNLILAAPTLFESYAVLTRLPPPHRLSPADAWALVRTSFVDRASEIVILDSVSLRQLLDARAIRA